MAEEIIKSEELKTIKENLQYLKPFDLGYLLAKTQQIAEEKKKKKEAAV